MTIADGIFQGIIQGVTEFLPISSSGHLSLYQHFTNNSGEGALSFSLMLHLGTLLAVCIVYRQDILDLVKELGLCVADIFKGRFSFKTDKPQRKLLFMLVVATLPLFAVVWAMDFIESFAQDSDIIVEGISFLITSCLLFFASRQKSGTITAKEAKVPTALFVGLAQVLALFPGVSRSGSTVSAGLMQGYKKSFAVKLSFLMGIPAILGGTVLDTVDMIQTGSTLEVAPVAVGFVTALIAGIASIKLLQFVLKTDKLFIFAIYTLILGLTTVGIGIFEHL